MPTWTVASAQSTSSPFIQILLVARICGLPRLVGWPLASYPACRRRSVLAEVGGAGAGEAREVERREPGHVPLAAGADPDELVREQLAREQHLRDPGRGERGDAARLEARRGDDLRRLRDPRLPRARGGRDLGRVRAPVAGDERERRTAVADEDAAT